MGGKERRQRLPFPGWLTFCSTSVRWVRVRAEAGASTKVLLRERCRCFRFGCRCCLALAPPVTLRRSDRIPRGNGWPLHQIEERGRLQESGKEANRTNRQKIQTSRATVVFPSALRLEATAAAAAAAILTTREPTTTAGGSNEANRTTTTRAKTTTSCASPISQDKESSLLWCCHFCLWLCLTSLGQKGREKIF